MRLHRMLSRTRAVTRERATIIWFVLLTALLVLFITRSEGEIGRTIEIVRNSSVPWLLAAVLTEAVIVFGFILVLALILARLGHHLGWATFVRAYFHRIVVGALTPVSGPASSFAFTRHVGARGVPTDDALLALALNGVVGYGSFVFFLIPMLIFLELQHRVSLLLLVGAAILMAVFLLLVVGVYLLLREAGPPAWLVNRVLERARSFAIQVRSHQIQPRDLARPFIAAYLVEVFGVVLLYTCLRAIGQEPTIATALTAYAVGTTFVIISPFFSGIGLVELGMVVALREFGISDGSALAATLLYRAAELWLPLLFGLSLQVGSRQEVRRLSVHVPAALTFFSGLVAVLSVLAPTLPQRFNRIGDYSFLMAATFSRSFVVVSGFFLMVLSYNLWRGKRVAWIAAVVLLAASIPAHLFKHHDELVVIPTAFTLALLLVHRHRFTVRSDAPTMRQGALSLRVKPAVRAGLRNLRILPDRPAGVRH